MVIMYKPFNGKKKKKTLKIKFQNLSFMNIFLKKKIRVMYLPAPGVLWDNTFI